MLIRPIILWGPSFDLFALSVDYAYKQSKDGQDATMRWDLKLGEHDNQMNFEESMPCLNLILLLILKLMGH